MNDYDFIAAVEKRYSNMLSLGGAVEKSFWQNVGKIANKKEFAEMEDSVYTKMMNNINKIMQGERR